eukprot:CAMPEP_0119546396 /NCGR_PEP_ID=MMETSP1352-20130426/842_1 /TAXON_ID=265584 /ORGANISM="Stauroneis constricta, Strain CCMP1120" /LENGTH=190 /DNA_ID=CAMNT_0007591099 /DNA_START=63 /DNA_END=635 /DNA_ORIENTATION=-
MTPPSPSATTAEYDDTLSSTYKKVGFDTIEIYEFPYILGDNPSVSAGAPIALGPDLLNYETMELDVYEYSQSKMRKERKSSSSSSSQSSSSSSSSSRRKNMILPVQKRAQLLLSQGYSIESIASATLEADTISKERNMSVSKQKWDGVNEMSERFGRFFRKSVSRRNSLTGSGSSSMTPPKKQSIAANSA